jgi:hypothetical protein
MAAWSRYQGRHQPNQIIVHVTWVTERCGTSRHNSGHQGIRLSKRRIWDVKPVHRNSVQGRVVQDHDTVRIQRQALQRQQRIVGLDDHITSLHLIRKHTVRLHQLLAIPVIERFQKVRTHSCKQNTSSVTCPHLLQASTLLRCSSKLPEPVPPAIEWQRTNPSRLSLPSASLSIMSMISSSTCSPCKQMKRNQRTQDHM